MTTNYRNLFVGLDAPPPRLGGAGDPVNYLGNAGAPPPQ